MLGSGGHVGLVGGAGGDADGARLHAQPINMALRLQLLDRLRRDRHARFARRSFQRNTDQHDLSRAGPGMFPLIVSGALFLIGVITLICASLTTTPYSVPRVLKISAGLILVGLAFQKLLGFNLPLY
jgi:hypothetical protein